MKKKLSCLVLALLMLVGMCACTKSTGVDTSGSTDYNMTLSLWLPTSKDTTSAAIKKVEAAINAIIKKSNNTAIELHAISDDKYEATVKDEIEAIEARLKQTADEEASRKKASKEAKKNGEVFTDIVETTEVETTFEEGTDENGDVIEFFPSVSTNQLDIFCIRGYEDFTYYCENGYLSPIDESLAASSKLIKSYVYPSFLDAGKYYGINYTVPTNHVIGDYTFMLVNKKLCEQLHYDRKEFTTLLDAESFITAVGKNTSVTPFVGEISTTGLKFWSAQDDGRFSILGTLVSDESDPNARQTVRNVFGLKAFTNTVAMEKRLKEAGYVSSDTSIKEFGVSVIKCDLAEVRQYEDDYYAIPIAMPRAETEDMYQSMFAVSAYSADVSRAMQVITLINTDPTIRTLLQYGVEGVHWKYADDEQTTIKIISDEYKMDLINTGNEFLTFPGEGIPMSYWDDARQQNLDSLKSPFIGFTNYVTEDNTEFFDAVDKYSKDIMKRIDAMTAAEFEDAIKGLKKEVGDSDEYNDMISTTEEKYTTLVAAYQNWYADRMGQ